MEKEIKVLIIDIDEVMNNRYTFMEAEVPCIDPSVTEMIRELVNLYDFEISFISTWLDNFPQDEYGVMVAKLSEGMGLGRRIFSECPVIPHEGSSFRGDRINLFHELLEQKNITLKDYVIIDDSCDYYMNQMTHLIHVDGLGGFSIRDYLAIRGRYEEVYAKSWNEKAWTSGVYLDQDARWISHFREGLESYKTGVNYEEGQVIHLEEQGQVVMWTKSGTYSEQYKCTPIILTGPNANARILTYPEISRLAQESFIAKYSKNI